VTTSDIDPDDEALLAELRRVAKLADPVPPCLYAGLTDLAHRFPRAAPQTEQPAPARQRRPTAPT
jgi:hypothetical protein